MPRSAVGWRLGPNHRPGARQEHPLCRARAATKVDCAQLDHNVDNCDCYEGAHDRPLCEQTPGVSEPGTTQYWGKAYPGLRQLEVLKGFGEHTQNSVVASICARNTNGPERADFGYRPALAALLERLETQLDPE